MSKLRCAVIGVGYLGRFHAQKYTALPNVELIGVYDLSSSHAIQVASELNVRAYLDLEELIQQVDAVSIAASTKAHYTIAKKCLEHGIHVLVEKPITENLEQAQVLIDLAKDKKLILQVGHLERFNQAYQVFDKYLNQPQWIEMQRLAPFKKRGSDVDVILDLMIHDLDILLSWMKTPVESIQAQGFSMMTNAIDLASAVIKFENGCIANLTASRVHSTVERLTRVYQGQDYYVLNYQDQQLSRYITDPHSDDNLFLAHEPIPCVKQDALLLQIQSFVQAVLGESSVLVDGQAGYRALELALNIQSLIELKMTEAQLV
jgi:predicted dehydrogenase